MAEVNLRLFAGARQAAGTNSEPFVADTVASVLEQASEKFGAEFRAVLQASRVWCNGEACEPSLAVSDGDEIAVLPPVSGG